MKVLLFLFFLIWSSLSAQNPGEDLILQSVSQRYHEEFISLVELIYGEGFLSQGGKESVERMIAESSIENKKILDIGSGLGGPDLYLAKNYAIDITGLEPQEWLWKRSLLNLGRANLKGSLRFVLMEYPASLSQFADGSFDIVLSKETILHVPLEVKNAFFSEILRVLKPGGEIIIMDWMRTKLPYSEQTQKMMDMDGVAYHLITPPEYLTLLQETGFVDVQLENVSPAIAGYSQKNIRKIQELESKITEEYGREVFDYCIESWGYQRNAFATQELMAGIFRARKPYSFDYDLHLATIPGINGRTLICFHGYGGSYKLAESIKSQGLVESTLISFNFPDLETAHFGTGAELLPALYVLKSVVLDQGLESIDLYGFSAGGGALINAIAALNNSTHDVELKQLGIGPAEKKRLLAAIEKGTILLDSPLKSIEEIIDFRGPTKELEVLAQQYRSNRLRPIDSLANLHGLSLNITLYLSEKDEILSNRDDALFIERLPQEKLTVIRADEGGHAGFHHSLWKAYSAFLPNPI